MEKKKREVGLIVTVVVICVLVGALLCTIFLHKSTEASEGAQSFKGTKELILLEKFVNAVNSGSETEIAGTYFYHRLCDNEEQLLEAVKDYKGVTDLRYTVNDIIRKDDRNSYLYVHFRFNKNGKAYSQIHTVHMSTYGYENDYDTNTERANTLGIVEWIDFIEPLDNDNYDDFETIISVFNPFEAYVKGITEHDADAILEAYRPGAVDREQAEKLVSDVTYFQYNPDGDNVRLLTGAEKASYMPQIEEGEFVELYEFEAEVEYMLAGSSIRHSGVTKVIVGKYHSGEYKDVLVDWYKLPYEEVND